MTFDINITDALTISGLANLIYMKNYYNKYRPIPLINNKKYYKDIK